jgi:hypothetical protein
MKKYSARKIEKQENKMWEEYDAEKGNVKHRDISGYSRRDFLVAGGRAGGAAAVYGTGLGIVGKGYSSVKDYVNDKIYRISAKATELDQKVENLPKYHPAKQAKNLRELRSEMWGKITGRTVEDKADFRREYGINNPKTGKLDEPYKSEMQTRRSFLKSFLGYANKNPVKTGAALGMAYGASSSGIKQYSERRKENKIIKKVERRLGPVAGGLEKTLVIVGVLGIFLSFFLSLTNITGAVVSDSLFLDFKVFNVVILLIAIGLLIVAELNLKGMRS